ncbi:uncharacterized protein LAESUDRAFT_17982 [Laetiporus sulphureus 93-53]|uniref:MYND-type domain-containing protein n=1 Tax=Laetiporus sulphureus 93-53 TaxID=1314785 RepID=A0A165IB08_9APHY|nr:uncharacterized protein LAESUDRAFT_17982 [Laetiporus sulphureus 93-53]KZT12829.1 hypothetical protein LAESUDRAFT_17982 [Laetiporus sulphureus 93-53]
MSKSPAPPADFRHPESDPKEPLRKESTQCQNCLKSRADGAIMSRCSACRVDLYCSKECQKQAWPVHKARCKLNRRAQTLGDGRTERLKVLRDFTQKHRPTISEAGLRALDLCVDRTRADRDVLIIYLRPRPGATRIETQFYVIDADVMPFESLPKEKHEEMRSQLKYASEVNVKHGADVLDQLHPGQPWKELLITRLNEGIVN